MLNQYIKTTLLGVALLSSTSALSAVPSYSTGFDDTSVYADWRGGNALIVQWTDAACTNYANGDYNYPLSGAQVAGLETGSNGSSVLNTYTDYDNRALQVTGCITANIMREYTIQAGDEGDYEFKFTNLFPNDLANKASSANAFIKLIDPSNSYADALNGTKVVDMTGSEADRTITVTIDTSNVGMILQYGFSNNSSNDDPTGMYYDDVCFGSAGSCASSSGGGSSRTSSEAIPVLPLWAIFGLAGLIGLMGLRRKA